MIVRCRARALSTKLDAMVLHSSLSAATAAVHRHDQLVEAERYRAATSLRSFLPRIRRGAPGRPEPAAVGTATDTTVDTATDTTADKSSANRRYAMSR